MTPEAPAAVTGAVAWPAKGKPDVDTYRIGAPGPDGGVDAAAAPPPALGPDGGAAAAAAAAASWRASTSRPKPASP